LAQIIAQESKRPFYILSAINSGVKDIRDVIEKRSKVVVYSLQKSYSFL
jgi:replication-associated recombination protein RarA